MSAYRNASKTKQRKSRHQKKRQSSASKTAYQIPSLPPGKIQQTVEAPHFAPPKTILQMQRLYGNRAVGQMIASAKAQSGAKSNPIPPVVQRTVDVTTFTTLSFRQKHLKLSSFDKDAVKKRTYARQYARGGSKMSSVVFLQNETDKEHLQVEATGAGPNSGVVDSQNEYVIGMQKAIAQGRSTKGQKNKKGEEPVEKVNSRFSFATDVTGAINHFDGLVD